MKYYVNPMLEIMNLQSDDIVRTSLGLDDPSVLLGVKSREDGIDQRIDNANGFR